MVRPAHQKRRCTLYFAVGQTGFMTAQEIDPSEKERPSTKGTILAVLFAYYFLEQIWGVHEYESPIEHPQSSGANHDL